MKKILIALALLPLLIVACSSDDDVTKVKDFDHNIELLYGEWRATNVDVSGVPIDLTTTKIELLVAPTYLTFGENGTLVSEGILGDGTGTYGAKGKTVSTSVGKSKVNFEMTSLNAKTAKIKLDSKLLGLPLIPENAGLVTVTLTKDYERTVDFDYDIKDLYGEWRATTLEGVPDGPVDLTNPYATKTYMTFDKKGVYTAKGIMGDGTGRYATEDKMIYTLITDKVNVENSDNVEFEVTELDASTVKIVVSPLEVDLGLPLPQEITEVTITFKKQATE